MSEREGPRRARGYQVDPPEVRARLLADFWHHVIALADRRLEREARENAERGAEDSPLDAA